MKKILFGLMIANLVLSSTFSKAQTTPPLDAPFIIATITENASVQFDLSGVADNTKIWIETSENHYIEKTINKSWTGYETYNIQGTKVKIYGDIIGFDCGENNVKLLGLETSNNTELKKLYCPNNSISHLDVTQNTKLTEISCEDNLLTDLDVSNNPLLSGLYAVGNNFSTETIDAIFCSLPERVADDDARVYVVNNTNDENYTFVSNSNAENAKAKKWKVLFFDNDDEVFTSGEYSCDSWISDHTKNDADIQLYPNPTLDKVQITSNKSIKNIRVYNAEGKIVLDQNTNKIFSLKNNFPGVYLVKITTNNNIYTKKLIKK